MQGAQDGDELLAEAALERDPLGVEPARHEEHLLVLDVNALDRPDARGKSKTSGSLNAGRVKNPDSTSPPAASARAFSHTTGGLRH